MTNANAKSRAKAPATKPAAAAKTYGQAEFDAAVAAAEKRGRDAASAAAKPPAADAGPVLTIAGDAEAPGLVALTGTTKVVFADEGNRAIKTLPPLEFGPSDYQPGGARAVLKKDIEFPTGFARVAIAAAFLFDGATVVGKAALVQPFWVGGGRQARLPAGTLSFAGGRGPTPSGAPVEAATA